MSEHRVSMLGASWRRYEDPTRSRDPRVREVVGALAALPAAQPRPEFRAELRAQLVAITPRIVGESADPNPAMVDIVPGPKRAPAPRPRPAAVESGRARHSDSLIARLRHIPIGRPLAVVASVVATFALLLGGAVWMSQKSLPGDTLYGLKRASERVELATAGSATEKARDHLDFAATRAGEVRELLSRASSSAAGAGPQAAGGIDPATAKLITSTLSSADSDVKSAAELLGEQAVQDRSAAPLDTMKSWAPGQLSRLDQIAAAMPDNSLRIRTESSAHLVTAALDRARALAPKVTCGCLGSAGTDALGPKPCTICPAPATAPTTPGGGGQQPAHTGRSSAAPGHKAGQGGAATPANTARTGSATKATAPTQGSTSTSGAHLPALPSLPLLNPTPSLPVVIKSCEIGVGLGPIGIGIGLCPVTVQVTQHP